MEKKRKNRRKNVLELGEIGRWSVVTEKKKKEGGKEKEKQKIKIRRREKKRERNKRLARKYQNENPAENQA